MYSKEPVRSIQRPAQTLCLAKIFQNVVFELQIIFAAADFFFQFST